MKYKITCIVASAVAIFLIGVKVGALPHPINKPPSYLKLNSVTVKGHAKASAGQALVADGAAGTRWANVEGLDISSQVSGSPAANGSVLTANGQGQTQWVSSPPKFSLRAFQGVTPRVVESSQSLTAEDGIVIIGANGVALSLPLASNCPGQFLIIKNASGFVGFEINCLNNDRVEFNNQMVQSFPFTNAFQSVILFSDGTDKWYFVAGNIGAS